MSLSLRQLPNILTVIRIILVIPFAFYMSQQRYELALWVLLVAGISDGLDGFLARRFGWRTQFGSIADPVADKILLITTFLALGLTGNMPWWVVAVVVLRDVYIFIGAIAYWFMVGRYQGSPTLISKACTFFMIVLGLLALCNQVWPLAPAVLLMLLSWVVVALSLISLVQYTVLGVRGYASKVRQKKSRGQHG
jgi:cardiolipin synthase